HIPAAILSVSFTAILLACCQPILLVKYNKALSYLSLATLSTFNQACEDYYRLDFAAAIQGFEACLRINPSDNIAQIYLQRCLSH
ncbi:MAG: hypothetical protein NWQ43_12000, partial [Dolichospermum sp.]|nr:hypothetical protein [Dolichospermum sp.]